MTLTDIVILLITVSIVGLLIYKMAKKDPQQGCKSCPTVKKMKRSFKKYHASKKEK